MYSQCYQIFFVSDTEFFPVNQGFDLLIYPRLVFVVTQNKFIWYAIVKNV